MAFDWKDIFDPFGVIQDDGIYDRVQAKRDTKAASELAEEEAQAAKAAAKAAAKETEAARAESKADAAEVAKAEAKAAQYKAQAEAEKAKESAALAGAYDKPKATATSSGLDEYIPALVGAGIGFAVAGPIGAVGGLVAGYLAKAKGLI